MKKLLLAAILFLGAAPCWGVGAPPVGFHTGGGQTCTTCTETWWGASTTGNLGVFFVYDQSDATTTITSATSSCGTPILDSNSPKRGASTSVWAYTFQITSNGCNSSQGVSITFSGSITVQIYTIEYAGMAATNVVDCSSAGTGTGTALDSGSCATTLANETLVAGGYTKGTGSTFTAGASYTVEDSNLGGTSRSFEDRNVSATGSYNAPETFGVSGEWIIYMLALKQLSQPASGGGGFGGKLGIGAKAGYGYWQSTWRSREQMQ